MPLNVCEHGNVHLDLGYDAKGAQGDEGRAEEIGSRSGRAPDRAAVGQHDAEAADALGEKAMPKRGAVCCGCDGASDTLDVDTAEVGKSESVRG